MASTDAGIHSEIVGVVTPLGLGLERAFPAAADARRVAVSPDASPERFLRRLESATRRAPGGDSVLAVTDLHLASGPVLDHLDDRLPALGDKFGVVVVAAAGEVPVPLLSALAGLVGAGPLGKEGFPTAVGMDGVSGADAHAYSGGWPEAFRVDDAGRFGPSLALHRFVRELALGRPADAFLLALLAAAPDGLAIEHLADCLACSVSDAYARTRPLEEFGACAWEGDRIRIAFPAVGDALGVSGSDRRKAAVVLASRLTERGPGGAPAEIGPVGWTDLSELGGRLDTAERARDVATWGSLAAALAGSGVRGVRWRGLAGLVRLAARQGRERDAQRSLEEMRRMPPRDDEERHEIERLEFVCRLVALRGLDVPVLAEVDVADLGLLFPSQDSRVGVREHLGELLQAVFRADHEVRVPAPSQLVEGVEILHAMALAAGGDIAAARAVDLRTQLDASPLGALMEVVFDCAEGRWEHARSVFIALVGPDWGGLGRLHASIGLWVATGTDIDLARRLATRLADPMTGQTGAAFLEMLRARVDHVTGHGPAAGDRAVRAWQMLAEGNMQGAMAIVAMETLDILGDDERIGLIADAPPVGRLVPFAGLAGALRGDDMAALDAALGAFPPSSYASGRALRLAGRRAGALGDSERARLHLERAAALFEGLGAPVDADLAYAALRRISPRLGRRAQSPVTPRAGAGLTPREGDVHALVVRGLTNAEIAAQLHLARATVGRHVSAILRHYGVANRRQLIDASRDRL